MYPLPCLDGPDFANTHAAEIGREIVVIARPHLHIV